MIGYEFEFLVREGNRPMSRAKFEAFHSGLQQNGWKAKFDPDSKGLAGSTKDGIYITTDDGVGLIEYNVPPTNTVQESHALMTNLLNECSEILKTIGCAIIGTSVFPGDFDPLSVKCDASCKHPDCCSKSMIQYINAERFKEYHHYWFIIAANHIWLDVPKKDITQYLKLYSRLAPINYALFANGPIWQNQDTGFQDWRDEAWRIPAEHSQIPNDVNFYGLPKKEYPSTLDYFNYLLSLPPHFVSRDGISFRVQDRSKTMRDLIFSESTPALWGHGGEFDATPTIHDISELQHSSYPHARLKFFLRDGCTVQEFRDAISNQDEQALLNFFEKFCLEVRSVGAQKKDEVSVAPAFLLGLQQKLTQLEQLIGSQPYSFWVQMYDQVQKNGLNAVHQGVSIADVAEKVLALAQEGLVSRGKSEEAFIEPLISRLKSRINPATELQTIWKTDGLEGIFEARDF
ncbi:MAG: glutamate-cysteine ligase family protein [Candidatus Nitrotoga sp.]